MPVPLLVVGVVPAVLDLADLLDSARLLSCTWATGNGPGQGFCSSAEAAGMSCDATVRRVILTPDSVPLDIGRATRVVPAAIRHAVTLRDGGCVIPGCTRPPGWCEAHHVEHWAAGGRTAVQNLALICRTHHQQLHHGMWHIDMTTGTPQVTHTSNHNHRRSNRRDDNRGNSDRRNRGPDQPHH